MLIRLNTKKITPKHMKFLEANDEGKIQDQPETKIPFTEWNKHKHIHGLV